MKEQWQEDRGLLGLLGLKRLQGLMRLKSMKDCCVQLL
jgi:hypothetical protein